MLNDPFEVLPGLPACDQEDSVKQEEFWNTWRQGIVDNHGVICHSALLDDPVIWSHYAEGHSGIALEFDYLISDTLMEVRYCQQRPTMPVELLDMDNYNPFVKQILETKAPSWQYEKEFRVYVSLKDCTPRSGFYFTKIPDNFLTRVVLGVRCEVRGNYVQRLLMQYDWGDVSVAQAQLSPDKFSVDVRDVDSLS